MISADAPFVAQELESRPSRPWPLSVFLWTLGIGLGAGTLELALFLAKCHYFDPRNYNVSRHYPWMFPLAGLAMVLLPGVILTLAAAFWPRRNRTAKQDS